MKIVHIYIRGFGKLNKLDIELSSGMNVIFGHNEAGKSTLQEFIKAMLYGLKRLRGSKDTKTTGVKKYSPWNGGQFGGYIDIEVDNNKRYRIDRDFETGNLSVFDENFSDITSSLGLGRDGIGLGENILGINEELFERTVFIRQMGTRLDSNATKDLLQRVSNIMHSGNEDISYKKAMDVLKDALIEQVGTQKSYTRPLDIIEKRLQELSKNNLRIDEDRKRQKADKERYCELNTIINDLSSRSELVSIALEHCKLNSEIKELREKRREFRFLNEALRQASDKLELGQKEYEQISIQLTELRAEIERLSGLECYQPESFEQLHSLNRELNELQTQYLNNATMKDNTKRDSVYNQIKKMDYCIFISTVLTAAFLVLAYRQYTFLYYIASVCAILSGIIAFFRYIKAKLRISYDQEEKTKQNTLAKTKSDIEQKLTTFNNILKTAGVTSITELTENYNTLVNARKIEHILQQQLDNLGASIKDEKIQFDRIVERQKEINIAKTDIALASVEGSLDGLADTLLTKKDELYEKISSRERQAIDTVIETGTDQSTELKEIYQELQNRIEAYKLEKAGLYAVMSKLEDIDSQDELKEEIRLLSMRKANLEKRGAALDMARNVLQQASKEVQAKLLPRMNEHFEKYLSEITGNRYCEVMAGDSLTLTLLEPETQSLIPAAMLSEGTIDQVYLSLRLALGESISSSSQALPIIMDEPFAQYDDYRLKQAAKSLADISTKRQILVFSCKKRESEILQQFSECKICTLT